MSGGPRGTSPPLDLRAVQETLDFHDMPPEVGETIHTSTEHELTITQLRALLALLRETRAALREALSLSPSHPLFPNAHAIHERAAAVLAAAQDGPA